MATHYTKQNVITGREALHSSQSSPYDFNPASRSQFIVLLRSLQARLKQISRLIEAQQGAPTVLVERELSPNLFVLAAMHYGDLRAYGAVRDASGLSQSVVTTGDEDLDGLQIAYPSTIAGLRRS